MSVENIEFARLTSSPLVRITIRRDEDVQGPRHGDQMAYEIVLVCANGQELIFDGCHDVGPLVRVGPDMSE